MENVNGDVFNQLSPILDSMWHGVLFKKEDITINYALIFLSRMHYFVEERKCITKSEILEHFKDRLLSLPDHIKSAMGLNNAELFPTIQSHLPSVDLCKPRVKIKAKRTNTNRLPKAEPQAPFQQNQDFIYSDPNSDPIKRISPFKNKLGQISFNVPTPQPTVAFDEDGFLSEEDVDMNAPACKSVKPASRSFSPSIQPKKVDPIEKHSDIEKQNELADKILNTYEDIEQDQDFYSAFANMHFKDDKEDESNEDPFGINK
jgi:hypothetical protein